MKIDFKSDEILGKFVEQIMLEKGEDVDEEKKKKFVDELSKELLSKMIRSLSYEKLRRLEAALDDNASDDEILKILKDSDFSDVAVDVMSNFKKQYVGEEA